MSCFPCFSSCEEAKRSDGRAGLMTSPRDYKQLGKFSYFSILEACYKNDPYFDIM